ncbi:nitrilase-related carbon-nitrogen hydrolase [Brevibacillus choshinensis]|uniref:nitrilase-related carbon-nitrogen hydrolase n=1 Tax=Brevibacillus choshinensis TaxID=54911 RepID=UPI00399D07A2
MQMKPDSGQIEANLQQAIRMGEQAAQDRAHLIVFSELWKTGYHLKKDEFQQLAKTPTVKTLIPYLTDNDQTLLPGSPSHVFLHGAMKCKMEFIKKILARKRCSICDRLQRSLAKTNCCSGWQGKSRYRHQERNHHRCFQWGALARRCGDCRWSICRHRAI